jgi:hypothetical protein
LPRTVQGPSGYLKGAPDKLFGHARTGALTGVRQPLRVRLMAAREARGAAGRLKSYNLADFGRLPQCTKCMQSGKNDFGKRI